MKGFRFTVYEHTLEYESNILRRQFIVLKDEKGNIVKWTDFHKYARSGKKSVVKSIYSDSGIRCYNVVKFLNYVFDEPYNIRKLTDITVDMVRNFLNDYGLCKLSEDTEGTHRSKKTVNVCVAHIIDFLDLVVRDNPECKLKIEKLYTTVEVFSKKRRKYIKKRVPTFEVLDKSKEKIILRDIPEEPFQIIMNHICHNHTNILMLVALTAFAGLRPSEACNVRRVDSVLGAGMRFIWHNGKVDDIIIDLTQEKCLRSDLVNVGGIKRHRQQKVYPAFLDAFISCYNIYMKYITGKPYESDYGALTNTSVGKAYTYRNYYNKFRKAVAECIPKMLASDNPKVVNYGILLQEYNISPHILRHWFSVKITLYGEDIAGIMYWRGDKDPESALTYLQNKSELTKQYEEVAEKAINFMLWKAEKVNRGK